MRSLAFTACLIWSGLVLGASTALAAQGIEGRWETNARDLVLDISRCGEQFCGQAVKSTSECDRTVLTVAVNATSQTFDGELAVPGRAKPYKVKISITANGSTDGARMVIVGDDVEPSFVRRTFPFRALLVRAGDATCRPNPVS
jgi:uncharacterized protein (DUF2147 family)